MGRRGVSRRRRVSRWVLLLLLVVGVCGMHTLGHLRGHSGHGGAMSASMPAAQMPDPSAGSAFSRGEFPDLDPGAVCLAVLTSVFLLLLVMLRAHAHRRWEMMAAAGWYRGQVARPPPQLIASRLARLSVWRI
ncbi:DUF6153 family protein [Nonomuraea angiospora]|uniref:DUF6153 family protein n=1 Tax=Nonomuraea angiospora TaxID=46172 RepID=UPI0034297D75